MYTSNFNKKTPVTIHWGLFYQGSTVYFYECFQKYS